MRYKRRDVVCEDHAARRELLTVQCHLHGNAASRTAKRLARTAAILAAASIA